MSQRERIEEDSLGPRALPAEARYGIHTARALENFPLAGRVVHPALARAFGEVKLACAADQSRAGRMGRRRGQGGCGRAGLPRAERGDAGG
jgi:aspartate ammonia-lyase